MRTLQLSLLYFLPLLISSKVFSQFQQEMYRTDIIQPEDNQRLNLFLHASGFFNNNEFFGGNVEGYTLTGAWFQPSLEYTFAGNFSLQTGIHLLKYNGQDGFRQIYPVFALDYSPLPGLDIILGTFNKGANLGLPEPLYKFERQFTDITGQGIQIKSTGSLYSSVTWLDWMRFIEPGDPFREEFIFGHTSELQLLNRGNIRSGIPVHLIASHKGGQINSSNEPVETRFDLGTGLFWEQSTNLRVFERFKGMVNVFFEISEENNRDGNALLGYGELSGKIFSLGLGYFYQKNWDSILGESLFFSHSLPGSLENIKNQFAFFKAGLGKRITSSSSFTLRFEGYYDTNLGKFQYSYGLHILLNEWIGLLK